MDYYKKIKKEYAINNRINKANNAENFDKNGNKIVYSSNDNQSLTLGDWFGDILSRFIVDDELK